MTIRSTEMSNTHSPSLISIVFSFRNEAENIPVLIARIGKVFTAEDVDYELIFVNDASSDDSLSVLMQEHRRNPKVKVINMSRRFGVSECTRAGMEAARGAAVIYMDADLQDPPELIPKLLAHWRSGAQIVHTIRTRRLGESRFKMWLTKQAYRVIRLGSTVNIPVDAGDFKLLSRVAVDQLLRLRESDPYLRGLVAWIGFPYAVVPYDRVARHAGRTHFPFFSRNPWKTVVTGLTSFSFLPIYICGAFGALGLMISALMAALALVLKFRGDHGAGILAVLCCLPSFGPALLPRSVWSRSMSSGSIKMCAIAPSTLSNPASDSPKSRGRRSGLGLMKRLLRRGTFIRGRAMRNTPSHDLPNAIREHS